jgi:hypothetical protein
MSVNSTNGIVSGTPDTPGPNYVDLAVTDTAGGARLPGGSWRGCWIVH